MENGQPLKTITHDEFLTKYSNRLTDQPLSRHYRGNLDLDDLRKARYPPIKREQPNECRSFLFGVIKDRRRLEILAFFKHFIP